MCTSAGPGLKKACSFWFCSLASLRCHARQPGPAPFGMLGERKKPWCVKGLEERGRDVSLLAHCSHASRPPSRARVDSLALEESWADCGAQCGLCNCEQTGGGCCPKPSGSGCLWHSSRLLMHCCKSSLCLLLLAGSLFPRHPSHSLTFSWNRGPMSPIWRKWFVIFIYGNTANRTSSNTKKDWSIPSLNSFGSSYSLAYPVFF